MASGAEQKDKGTERKAHPSALMRHSEFGCPFGPNLSAPVSFSKYNTKSKSSANLKWIVVRPVSSTGTRTNSVDVEAAAEEKSAPVKLAVR